MNMNTIKLGKYIHYEGNNYEAIGMVNHSQTFDVMVLYKPSGTDELWACPVDVWNEIVEHNGRKSPRFIHEDDIKPIFDEIETDEIAVKRSKKAEKIDLFLSLFTGRTDVYAKRWENPGKGIAGYVPDCSNAWSYTCAKKSGKKIKCSECSARSFIPYDDKAIEKHFKGSLIAGVYPMLPDETCKFLAFDFDAKHYTPEELKRDVSAIRSVCDEIGINMAVERSRSGKGIHFWIFFSEYISAAVARKFGSSLITYTMNKHHELPFKTYDRLIPTQDSLPKGGFGNLIALPFQDKPRNEGNTVFLDENFTPYDDQWTYLAQIHRYSLSEIEQLTRQLSPTSDIGDLLQASEHTDEKPWEKKPASKSNLQKSYFPECARIVQANMLYIEKAGFKSPALNALKRLAAFRNPEFYKAQAMRLSTHKKARIISCSDETEQYICLPRGLENEVIAMLDEYDVNFDVTDERNNGRTIDVIFAGKLRGEQQSAADALLAHDNGILSATTAFGKTVIGAFLISERKVNTLILVNRRNLMEQWVDKLQQFLNINEEPVPEYTPTGRLRKKNIIGQIGDGKTSISSIIDVAVMQSLVSGEEVKELVKNYGMVIVDECHHVSAFSFEQIMKAVNAKYVYGLTATPTRKDGHHPIINMQCGKIRYKVDAKKQAEERPFDHYIIPRFTQFQKPMHREGDYENYQIICTDICENENRNNLIINDVIFAVKQGRNPIILSERVSHVQYLAATLNEKLKNVIALTGGKSKQSREALESVANIPIDEPFVLVATGKYIGEGFDMPRLDTLFLAMPISWTGTVQQYAGRLHRLFEGKNEVQIYDYVDIHVPYMDRMHQKRLKSYASIGYKAKDTATPIEEVHTIFDSESFSTVYFADIMAAKMEIVIVSPFLKTWRLNQALPILKQATAKVTVITKPSENYPERDRGTVEHCLKTLADNGIFIKTKDHIHQKFAVLDQRLVWYGSINLLSYGTKSKESIMRIDSIGIADELLRAIIS
ncbi:MAG: DUF1653 domain-containing protein [Defluviitaleaceae bacterium]|nr:DUF1653 domain-containing protein [Defluviitaleaceae bacterium]